MQLFHVIPDAVVILRKRGVYKQCSVYHRYRRLYGEWSNCGYILLMGKVSKFGATSVPDVSWVDLDIPVMAGRLDYNSQMVPIYTVEEEPKKSRRRKAK